MCQRQEGSLRYATSNNVKVLWLYVNLTTSYPNQVAPGSTVTITASAPVDVSTLGSFLEIFDQNTGLQVVGCSAGTSCQTSLVMNQPAKHTYIAYIASNSASLPPSNIQATSTTVDIVWLSITLAINGSTSAAPWYKSPGGSVSVNAYTNGDDLGNTPWYITVWESSNGGANSAYITCGTQNFCSGTLSRPDGTNDVLVANINGGSSTYPGGQVQATSPQTATIDWVLWGMDTCAPFTNDVNATTGAYPYVSANYGTPDFWGRYLTTACGPNAAISQTEVLAARSKGMAIMPIYSSNNCYSSGYTYGQTQAAAAIQAAGQTLIPPSKGIALFVDIEGSGGCGADAAFIQGWYDTITTGGYVAGYYANPPFTGGVTIFNQQFCQAVGTEAAIGTGSIIYSTNPDLNKTTKTAAPTYQPSIPSCATKGLAWQYCIQTNCVNDPNMNLDEDEAINGTWLWRP